MSNENSGVKIPKKQQSAKKRKTLFIVLAVLLCMFGAVIALSWNKILGPCVEMHANAVKLVSESTEDTFKASQTSLVYDNEGELMFSLRGEKDVYYLEYDEIPDAAKLAMISIEDKKFVNHRGVDPKAIIRAAVALVKNAGEVTQGGSTITQQLSRNVFLTHKVSWQRKVEEIFISIELEKKYSKEDIMEFYLNNVYFSKGYYGIQAASQGYFNKNVDELSLSQIAFLCAIPNGPSMYDPIDHPENTIKRRNRILEEMLEDEVISQEQHDAAVAEEITVLQKKKKDVSDYVETFVLKCSVEALMKEGGFEFKNTFDSKEEEASYDEEYSAFYDECLQSLYVGGYRIYTSIDLDMQNELQKAVNSKLSGFTGLTDDGDFKVQGSATCIDNETGRVVAIVGGRKVDDSKSYTFNRAYQSYRQPGSAIKPLLVFAPILERGMNPYSTVDDSKLDDEAVSNSGDNYLGRITLRKAVQKSSNVVTYRLYGELTPSVSLEYLEEMNFKGLEPEDYQYMTTCLGGFTRGTNTLEMAAAYATLANEGVYRTPTCIEKITTASGEEIVADVVEEKRIYQSDASAMMTDILQSVVDREPGTARGCKLYNQPAAAKTGTTTDNTDGWLCGYTPYYTTAVWVGQDQVKKVSGLSGSSYPAYIWTQFMKEVHEELPREEFPSYSIDMENDPYYAPETEESSSETEVTEDTAITDTSSEASTDTTSSEETTEQDVTTDTPEAPDSEEPTEAVIDTPVTVE